MRDIPIFGDKASAPQHLGRLELDEIQVWPNPRLGTSFYYGSDKVRATTHLYNLGLQSIPSDVQSSEVRKFFKQGYLDVLRTAASGLYLDLELSEPQFLYLPDDDRPFCLAAEFAFRHAPEAGAGFNGKCASHLALRTDCGFINKVRYTYPASEEADDADGSKKLLAFIVEWTVFVQAFASMDGTESVLVSVGPGPQRAS